MRRMAMDTYRERRSGSERRHYNLDLPPDRERRCGVEQRTAELGGTYFSYADIGMEDLIAPPARKAESDAADDILDIQDRIQH
jgi:hypothetical protein